MWHCETCDRTYKAKGALQQHIRDSSGHRTFCCIKCDRTFRADEALQQHLRDSPAHVVAFDCTDCGKAFGSEEALQQHLRDSPMHITTFDCIDCSKAFGTEKALQQHLRDSPVHAVTSDRINGNRALVTGEALQQHRRDSPLHPSTFDCIDCNKAFGTEGALQRHLQDSPAHATTIDRSDCGKASASNQASQQYLSRKAKSGNPWSMYPSLHHNVLRLLEGDNLSFRFHDVDESGDSIEEYDTNIMGEFTCNNGACASDKWPSRKIAITIRKYPGTKYNARVYNQRCKSCKRLGWPSLDDSYAERVAYRLKKWCGLRMDPPDYSGESKGPHQRELCEGCRNGHCKEGV